MSITIHRPADEDFPELADRLADRVTDRTGSEVTAEIEYIEKHWSENA